MTNILDTIKDAFSGSSGTIQAGRSTGSSGTTTDNGGLIKLGIAILAGFGILSVVAKWRSNN